MPTEESNGNMRELYQSVPSAQLICGSGGIKIERGIMNWPANRTTAINISTSVSREKRTYAERMVLLLLSSREGFLHSTDVAKYVEQTRRRVVGFMSIMTMFPKRFVRYFVQGAMVHLGGLRSTASQS